MRGPVTYLVALVAGAGAAAAEPVAGPIAGPVAAAVDGRVLAVEPLDPVWHDRLVAPLIERLRPVASYQPTAMPAEGIVDRVMAEPAALGLMRRSSLPRGHASSLAVSFIEVGPAACLVLAVAPEAPWQSYAELSYGRPAPGLRVHGAGAGGLAAFERLHGRFPLAADLVRAEQPFQLGVQRLLDGDIDVLAFEVARRGRTVAPPELVVAAMASDLRLLSMPTHLGGRDDDRLAVDGVPLEAAPFWGEPRRYDTFCDPFVLVFAPAFAEALLAGLDRRPEADPDPDPGPTSGPGFRAQIEAAARSFVVMVRQWL